MKRRLALLALVVGVTLATPVAAVPASAQTVVATLPELMRVVGDAPRADGGRLRIPSIGLDAPIGVHDVPDTPGTQMPDRYGPGDVSRYEFEHLSFGGVPGGGGNVVVSGHIDYHANVAYAGVR